MVSHPSLRRCCLLALAATLALADLSLAGPFGRGGRVSNVGVDYGFFRGPYRGGYGGRGNGNGYAPSYYDGFDYGPQYYYPPPPPQTGEEQRSYYPPQPATPQPATATIELYVPANAEVWFQGRKTTQTGTLRRFITTPLPPGVDYSYEMQVRWTDANGQVQEQTRQVVAQAGRQVIVNLQEAPKK
jgi:uncharacterized protein (TIGR03000 family)